MQKLLKDYDTLAELQQAQEGMDAEKRTQLQGVFGWLQQAHNRQLLQQLHAAGMACLQGEQQ